MSDVIAEYVAALAQTDEIMRAALSRHGKF